MFFSAETAFAVLDKRMNKMYTNVIGEPGVIDMQKVKMQKSRQMGN